MERDLRELIEPGFKFTDRAGVKYLVINNYANYKYVNLSNCVLEGVIYNNFNEDLTDVLFNNRHYDIMQINDKEGKVVWKRNKDEYYK